MNNNNRENININDWVEYRKLVLAELERLSEEVNKLYALVNKNKDDGRDVSTEELDVLEAKIERKLTDIHSKIDTITANATKTDIKTSNIYAASAAISVLIGIIIAIIGVVVTVAVGYWQK